MRWHRLDLESTLSEVAACLGRLEQRDITAFAKELIETAESLARRMIESEKAEEIGRDQPPLAATTGKKSTRAKAPKATASKAVPTDDFRAAMKLVLMLVAAVYRDALILESAASRALSTLPERFALGKRPATDENGADPESCIRAVAEAETMLDRNVNNQLLCEHLAARLSGSILSAAP